MAQEVRRPFFLTYEVARKAVELVWQGVIEVRPVLANERGHIVVVVPVRCGRLGASIIEGDFLRVIPDVLFSAPVGNQAAEIKWPLKDIAMSKATLQWVRYVLGVECVADEHLFVEGDTKFTGGVMYKGFVVVCSGFKEEEDEEISRLVAEKMEELAKIEYQRWLVANPDASFIN